MVYLTKMGISPFGSMPDTRQKFHQTQQGCDLMGVIDAEKKVIMRYIKLGTQPGIESPHFVDIDREGRYAYVCYVAGTVIHKIDIAADSIVGEVSLTGGQNNGLEFNIVKVSPDGTKLVASQLRNGGSVLLIDAVNMKVVDILGDFQKPHGIAYNATFDTFYITGQYGNAIFKVPAKGKSSTTISIDGKPVTTRTKPGITPDPHEIIMAPDYSKYFLSCENTNEVRVIDRTADTVIKVIPVGIKPQEFAMSSSMPYLFVTCMEDNSPLAGFRGSVYVINYKTLEIVKRIDGTFFQPHGVAIDEYSGTFIVASRNSNPNGPAPHHASECGGRNGYYQVFDLNTLKPLSGKRYEVTPEPYSMAPRFR